MKKKELEELLCTFRFSDKQGKEFKFVGVGHYNFEKEITVVIEPLKGKCVHK